jgi:hypothetical protein
MVDPGLRRHARQDAPVHLAHLSRSGRNWCLRVVSGALHRGAWDLGLRAVYRPNAAPRIRAFAQYSKCITLHCMDAQLTLRVPADLARRLAARAKATGAKRSQLVREALQAYLGPGAEPPRTTSVRERLEPYIGAVSLDRPSLERDDLAQRLRSHNWRE